MLSAEQTLSILQRFAPAGARLVVAVSGGADSLVLLHLLTDQREYPLHVATFDHGLRGDTGAADAAFVVATATAWGLPVAVGRGQLDPTGANREAAARAARYRFLAEVAREVGAGHVLTAHHADDQAETVLLHLLRGAGVAGLAAMSLSTPLPFAADLTLLRPLLHATRAEIEAYCAAHDLHPRHDATNDDPDANLRARLRHEVLPLLKAINPQVVANLNRTADLAAVEDDYLRGELHRLTDAATRYGEGRVAITLAAFRKLHPAMQRRWIYNVVSRLSDPTKPVSMAHVLEAVAVGVHGATGSRRRLPGGLWARVDYAELVIERDDLPLPPGLWLSPHAEVLVTIPGSTPTPNGWTLHADLTRQPEIVYHAAVPVPSGAAVTLRTRRPGDRFGRHKLKEWFIDHQVPQRVRDHVPLLTVNGTVTAILWGERWAVAEGLKPDMIKVNFSTELLM